MSPDTAVRRFPCLLLEISQKQNKWRKIIKEPVSAENRGKKGTQK